MDISLSLALRMKTSVSIRLLLCLLSVFALEQTAFAQQTINSRLFKRIIDSCSNVERKLWLIEHNFQDAANGDSAYAQSLIAQQEKTAKLLYPNSFGIISLQQKMLKCFLAKDFPGAMTAIDAGIASAEKEKQFSLLSRCLLLKTIVLTSIKKDLDAKTIDELFTRAITAARKSKSVIAEAVIWFSWSRVYYLYGDNPSLETKQKIFSYIDSAETYSKRSGSLFLYERVLQFKGLYNNDNRRMRIAQPPLLEAIQISEQIHDTTGWLSALGNLAMLYAEIENYKQAEEMNAMNLKLSMAIHSNYRITHSYSTRANLFSIQGKFDSAIANMRKAMHYDFLERKKVSALQFGNFGEYLLSAGMIDSAKYYQEIALKLRLAGGNREGELYSYMSLATIALEEKKYDLVVSYALRALEIEKVDHYIIYTERIYFLLNNGYEGMGNWKLAYFYLDRRTALKDSVDKANNKSEMLSLQSEYDEMKLKSEFGLKQQLSNEREKQTSEKNKVIRNSLVGGIGAICVILLILGFAYQSKRKANKLISKEKLEVENQKELVEIKQKEILDSIHYAKRIQQSLLPTDIYIGKNINRLKK